MSSPTTKSAPTDQEIINAVRYFWHVTIFGRAKEAPYPTENQDLLEKYTPEQILYRMYDMFEREVLDFGVKLEAAWVVEDITNHVFPPS